MDITITFTVNGQKRTVTTNEKRSLLDVLREDLHLTDTKYGCGEGRCGACAVLLDGKRTLSCITPAVRAKNKSVTTIKGLSNGGKLHPVQEAFLTEGAMQCGYCTSGMVLTATALLEKNPNPTDEEIVAAMNGNICRCNGYTKILAAVKRAAKRK
jgi:aerobic carbon-monoxide dehydrogenase small subunit